MQDRFKFEQKPAHGELGAMGRELTCGGDPIGEEADRRGSGFECEGEERGQRGGERLRD
jgi:hypothetical protein